MTRELHILAKAPEKSGREDMRFWRVPWLTAKTSRCFQTCLSGEASVYCVQVPVESKENE